MRCADSVVTGELAEVRQPEVPVQHPATQADVLHGERLVEAELVADVAESLRGRRSRIEPPSFVIVGSPGMTRIRRKMTIGR